MITFANLSLGLRACILWHRSSSAALFSVCVKEEGISLFVVACASLRVSRLFYSVGSQLDGHERVMKNVTMSTVQAGCHKRAFQRCLWGP